MIIDSHAHVGYETRTQYQKPKDLLRIMDASGIDKSVVFPFGPEFSKNQSYSRINEAMASLLSNKRFIPFGRINQLSKDMFSEAENISSLGLKGIKIHTHRESIKWYGPLFRKMDKFDLPLIIHTGNNYNSDVRHLRNMPFSNPIIIAHGGKDRFLDAVELVNSSSNIYIETSLLSLRRTQVLIKKIKDKSKILFGSDSPFHHPELESKKIRYACSDKYLVEDILGNNIKKILK